MGDHAEIELMSRQLGAGDTRGCARVASEVMRVCHDPSIRARARAMMGLVYQRAGRASEARDHFLAAADMTAEPEFAASFTAYAALSHVLGRDLDSAEARALDGVRLGGRCGNPHAVCEGLGALALVRQSQGRPARGLQLARRAVWLSETENLSRRFRPTPRLYVAMALIDLDRLAEADRELCRGLRHARLESRESEAAWFLAFRVLCRFVSGRWDDAVVDIAAALKAAESSHTLVVRPMVWGIGAMLEFFRGNSAAARDLLDAGGPHRIGAADGFGSDWLVFAQGMMDPDPTLGFATMKEAWVSSRDLPWLLSWRMVAPALVRAAIAIGDRDLAQDVTDEVVEGERLSGGQISAWATLLRCQGLLEDDPVALSAATEAFLDSGRPLSAGYAALDAARAWTRRGEPERARDQLVIAGESFHVLRATASMAQVGRLLARREPVAVLPTAPARTDPLARLTRSERAVAELAARGMTNPAIAIELHLSARTVQAHLSHVYAKLGLTSRVQLAGLVARD